MHAVCVKGEFSKECECDALKALEDGMVLIDIRIGVKGSGWVCQRAELPESAICGHNAPFVIFQLAKALDEKVHHDMEIVDAYELGKSEALKEQRKNEETAAE